MFVGVGPRLLDAENGWWYRRQDNTAETVSSLSSRDTPKSPLRFNHQSSPGRHRTGMTSSRRRQGCGIQMFTRCRLGCSHLCGVDAIGCEKSKERGTDVYCPAPVPYLLCSL